MVSHRDLCVLASVLVELRDRRALFTVEDFIELAPGISPLVCSRFLTTIRASGRFGLTRLGVVTVNCAPYGGKNLVCYGFEEDAGGYGVEDILEWWMTKGHYGSRGI